MTTRRDDCPCGRDAAYADCCGPYHRGGSAADAETLMRSRYAAFVKRDVPYLHRTLHPSHDDGEVAFVDFEASMKKHFASGVVYQSLSILGTSPEDEDGVSKVLFVARLAQRGRDRSFAEVSSFARVNGEIRYLTGITMPIADIRGLSGETAVREAETRHAARVRTPRG